MTSERLLARTIVSPGGISSGQKKLSQETSDPYTEGAPLGGVTLGALIGSGGMGRVYLGHHEVLDIKVAVKIVLAEHSSIERFLVEARLVARIQHENVMRIHHAGGEGERLYLVLEYIDGSTLKDLIAESGRLPWRRACKLIAQAARGLGAIHQAGIVHRDVKPSNMMLTKEGVVKVTDLGLARETSGKDGPTAYGSVLGSAAYMAPEQAKDPRRAKPPADVYALGVVLYEMVSGQLPFQRETTAGMLLDHLNTPPPDLNAIMRDLPDELTKLVHRMLDKDPGNRPVNGEELAAELERVLDLTAPTTVPSTSLLRRNLRRGRVATVGVAALSVGIIAALGNQLAPFGNDGRAPGAKPAQVAPADAWQTPRRAVFLLADRLTTADEVAITKAMLASGLQAVDRARIDATVRELDLSIAGRVDADTAAKIGVIVGGNIALYAGRHEGDEIEILTFAVETTEIAACEVARAQDVPAAVDAALRKALNLLPARGYVSKTEVGLLVSLGAQHGMKAGDHVELIQDETADHVIGSAVVTVVDRSSCVITTELESAPGRARKAAP
jgi:hypothetical protein